ncbi:hypothetical protein QBC40DRAFT_314502 [Triangularia verruculosa]|uniref:Uncharacterized protein n=1 Tax=Triangularia verruculosa TaxID=2587418 RepID=A0AAN6XN81_9PEZI|nr:hypothetical protein QBC40DRAFT_314502 [Triangularia verruculosa]
MPSLRGIEISISTSPDDEKIPEYPHPEGSRFPARSFSQTVPDDLPKSLATTFHPTPSQYHKYGPSVSVYIPSVSGTRFAINYAVNTPPPPPCKFVFFRLYMNARPISAWGIEPAVKDTGRVVKSLWAPGSRYLDQVGIEGRNFVFLPGQEHKSVAEDGGLIEIQVYRARARRAKAPKLEEYRLQDNYGIAVGLVDQPQDMSYYTFILMDPKESPFASFRFHYRTWGNLEQLNLIPTTELDFLRTMSPSAKHESGLDLDSTVDDLLEEVRSPLENSDEAVFEDSEEMEPKNVLRRKPSVYVLNTPPERFQVSTSKAVLPQPSKALRDCYRESYLQRPLPELPIHQPPGRPSRRSSAASAVSAVSGAPSITPSLCQHIDDDSFDLDNTEFGMATVAKRVRSPESVRQLVTPEAEDEPNVGNGEEYSISNYEMSPLSTNGSISDSKLSPGGYLPMTGSNFDNGLAAFTPPHGHQHAYPVRQYARPPSMSFFHPQQEHQNIDQLITQQETLTLTEAQWMSRSPSPPQTHEDRHVDGRRAWSPRPAEKNGSRGLFAGLKKKKFSASPRKLAQMVRRREVSANKGDTASEGSMEGRVGNWI